MGDNLKIKIVQGALAFISNTFHKIFFSKYVKTIKGEALTYLQTLKQEIKSCENYQIKLNSYISETWLDQVNALNFEKKIPVSFLDLDMSKRMFYKLPSQIPPLFTDLIQRGMQDIKFESLFDFKEPRVGSFLGRYHSIDFLGVQSISPNTASMLYFLANIKKHLEKYDRCTIVEIGGGYGSLANLITKYFQGKATYVIIDLPEMLALQYAFLSHCLGNDKVVGHMASKKFSIEKNKINLIPTYGLDLLDIKADAFITTFALTESTLKCQEDVYKKRYFDADFLYLVGHDANELRGDKDKWDTLRFTLDMIKYLYQNVEVIDYPQEDCHQIFAVKVNTNPVV